MRDGASEDPQIGRVLSGSYRLVRKLGTGGMGSVYLAEHTRLHKKVAVKTLHREITSHPEAYRRFQREAEIASQLGHPNIIAVHDFDHADDGMPYMVMDYLEGEDLEERLARVGALSVAQLARIISEVGSALQAAHERGIVHRDLKPSNIYLCRFGDRTDLAKVLDFGISKIRGSASLVTQTNSYMGTPYYMAPEQAEGRAAEADARTDVFALGSIMYRALAGRDAFSGDLLAVMYQIVNKDPQPVHELSPHVPESVSRVIQTSMAKRSEDRYASAAQLSKALADAAGSIAPRIAAAAPVSVAAATDPSAPTLDGQSEPPSGREISGLERTLPPTPPPGSHPAHANGVSTGPPSRREVTGPPRPEATARRTTLSGGNGELEAILKPRRSRMAVLGVLIAAAAAATTALVLRSGPDAPRHQLDGVGTRAAAAHRGPDMTAAGAPANGSSERALPDAASHRLAAAEADAAAPPQGDARGDRKPAHSRRERQTDKHGRHSRRRRLRRRIRRHRAAAHHKNSRRAAKKAARRGRAELWIVTLSQGQSVWAHISVDGKKVGSSPVRLRQLAAGRHTIEVHRSGFRPSKRRVTLKSGEQRKVLIGLVSR